MNFTVRMAALTDAAAVAKLMTALWPQNSFEDMQNEAAEIIQSSADEIFICEASGEAIGFAHVSLRCDYVEGTSASPVGYLEGIYVDEAHRGNGAARALLSACEEWSRAKNCAEFASDCELLNIPSHAFHIKNGFEEANRIICFKKRL